MIKTHLADLVAHVYASFWNQVLLYQRSKFLCEAPILSSPLDGAIAKTVSILQRQAVSRDEGIAWLFESAAVKMRQAHNTLNEVLSALVPRIL